eukprot:6904422-Pyramimonas_sp.AAC.1
MPPVLGAVPDRAEDASARLPRPLLGVPSQRLVSTQEFRAPTAPQWTRSERWGHDAGSSPRAQHSTE